MQIDGKEVERKRIAPNPTPQPGEEWSMHTQREATGSSSRTSRSGFADPAGADQNHLRPLGGRDASLRRDRGCAARPTAKVCDRSAFVARHPRSQVCKLTLWSFRIPPTKVDDRCIGHPFLLVQLWLSPLS